MEGSAIIPTLMILQRTMISTSQHTAVSRKSQQLPIMLIYNGALMSVFEMSDYQRKEPNSSTVTDSFG